MTDRPVNTPSKELKRQKATRIADDCGFLDTDRTRFVEAYIENGLKFAFDAVGVHHHGKRSPQHE